MKNYIKFVELLFLYLLSGKLHVICTVSKAQWVNRSEGKGQLATFVICFALWLRSRKNINPLHRENDFRPFLLPLSALAVCISTFGQRCKIFPSFSILRSPPPTLSQSVRLERLGQAVSDVSVRACPSGCQGSHWAGSGI
jgi:hypothetical protein